MPACKSNTTSGVINESPFSILAAWCLFIHPSDLHSLISPISPFGVAFGSQTNYTHTWQAPVFFNSHMLQFHVYSWLASPLAIRTMNESDFTDSLDSVACTRTMCKLSVPLLMCVCTYVHVATFCNFFFCLWLLVCTVYVRVNPKRNLSLHLRSNCQLYLRQQRMCSMGKNEQLAC